MNFIKTTQYSVTFKEETRDRLNHIAKVLEDILPEGCYVEVRVNTGFCDFVISTFEDLTE